MSVSVKLRNDRYEVERVTEHTTLAVDEELATLFAYSRHWAGLRDRDDRCELTFSSMLAAMAGNDLPLCEWLRRYIESLGVPVDRVTGGVVVDQPPLYAPGKDDLTTTSSFRAALATAEVIRARTSGGEVLAVRHYMAAYAVSPTYHLRDFRRLGIDRRDWCHRLADQLGEMFPAERDAWQQYKDMAPQLLPLRFDSDRPDGPDHLHLNREVEAFARLIASKATSTPLSIGVFGAWGSGKSFFMRRTRDRVAELTTGSEGQHGSDFLARIAQVEFNAWHYEENELIASLVDHIFRNLRIDVEDEDDVELRRRGAALMSELAGTRHLVASSEQALAAAETRWHEAERAFDDVLAQLPEQVGRAQRKVLEAEVEERRVRNVRDEALAARDVAIRRAATTAEAAAWVGAVADEETASALGAATDALVHIADDARKPRTRWRPIVVGGVLLVLAAVFAVVAATQAWAAMMSAVSAVTAFVMMARSWLVKLGDLAKQGQEFADERRKLRADAVERARVRSAPNIEALDDEVLRASASTAAARRELEEVSNVAGPTEELDASREQVDVARSRLVEHRREVERIEAALDASTLDSLLQEFLEGRAGSDDYRSRLGLFSLVRNDFERLSRLIERATREHAESGADPPTVSRIVLYIDDLDRCPRERVIEVLRAIHLLLAFPVFVCVAAVDPRWLSHCLADAPGLPGSDPALAAQFGKPADGVDYIEKIFQVPVWLRPVPLERRAALLRSWLDVPVTDVGQRQTAGFEGTTKAEVEFIEKLTPMLDGEPRTLKRLANTYRLVKTAMSDVDYRAFSADRPSTNIGYPPYKLCLTQLAILHSDRDRALEMIRSVELEPAGQTVTAWLDSFVADQPVLTEFLRDALDPGDDLKLAEFRYWLDRTRRYSFYL